MSSSANWNFHLTTTQIRLLGELAAWADETLPGTVIYGPMTADYVRQWATHVDGADADATHVFTIDDHGYRFIHGWLTRYATDHGADARDAKFGPVTNIAKHHRRAD